MKSTLFALIVLMTASATSAKCLDEKIVRSTLAPFIISYDSVEPTPIGALCDEKNILYKLTASLLMMEQTQNEGLVANSESIVAKEGPLNFFKARIKEIVIESKDSGTICQYDGVGAYVSHNEGQKTHICAEMFNSLTPFSGSEVLIHESRHVEGYGHAFCNHGYFKEKDLYVNGACDQTYNEQGSYGVAAGYKIHVAKTAKDAAIKQEARASAIDDLISRFNEFPWDLKPGLVTMTQRPGFFHRDKSREVSFFDGQNVVPMFKVPDQTIMADRFGIPSFYYPNGQVKSKSYDPQMTDTLGTFAEEYRKQLTPAQQDDVLDIQYGLQYSCQLYSRVLKCGSGSDKNVEINLADKRPVALVPEGNFEDIRFLLITEDGSAYRLPQTIDDFMLQQSDGLQLTTTSTDVISQTETLGNREYYVTDSSHLMVKENYKWERVEQYKNKKLQKIIPFVWSKKLESL